MSISGIYGSSFYDYDAQSSQKTQNKMQQGFDLLGEDLSSGNLSAAQSDFTTLQSYLLQASSTSSTQSSDSTTASSSTSSSSSASSSTTQSSDPLAAEFSQLSQDLKSGDLSAAQSDYEKIQEDMKNQANRMPPPPPPTDSSTNNSDTSTLLQELGQALHSGNLSSAQQAYAALQQELTGSSSITSTSSAA